MDAGTNEVIYTVRIKGREFAPHAPKGKTVIVKAGADAPDTVVVKSASVGSAPQQITLP